MKGADCLKTGRSLCDVASLYSVVTTVVPAQPPTPASQGSVSPTALLRGWAPGRGSFFPLGHRSPRAQSRPPTRPRGPPVALCTASFLAGYHDPSQSLLGCLFPMVPRGPHVISDISQVERKVVFRKVLQNNYNTRKPSSDLLHKRHSEKKATDIDLPDLVLVYYTRQF